MRVCTVCLNWKAVIKCVDLSTISSSSQHQWRTNRSTAMSHQAPRITTPPSISLSLPPSTSTQLSITLSSSHYTFLCPTLSKLPTIPPTLRHAHDTSRSFSLCSPWNSCSISTSIRHAPVYLSTSQLHPHHRPSLFDLFLPSLSPLLTSPRPPENRWVIKFATVAGRRATEGGTGKGRKAERGSFVRDIQ